MKKYQITTVDFDGITAHVIQDTEDCVYFAGYDDMGSVDWVQFPEDSLGMELSEAQSIAHDLELADEPADPCDPAKTEYLLKTVCEGIRQASVKTGRQIADIYETDQIAGIFSSMEVWDIRSVKIDLYDLVDPILAQKRWMEQEYQAYCENVNEYGLDFEGRDE